MKKASATRSALIELRDVDALIGGLPKPGVLVGNGRRTAIGDGVTDTFGWTLYRYPIEPDGPYFYSIDALLETRIAAPHPEIPAVKLNRCRALVAAAQQMPEEP